MGAWTRSEFDIDDGTYDYPDTGCWVAPHCLECPLPACLHDLAGRKAKTVIDRDRLLSLLATDLSVDAAAAQLGISRSTYFRRKRELAHGNTVPLRPA